MKQLPGQETSQVRALFVVPTLGIGGTERLITQLLPGIDESRIDVALVCTGEEGELFDTLLSRGIKCSALHSSGPRNGIRALSRLSSEIRKYEPDVIVSAGEGSTFVARMAGLRHRVKQNVLWVHESSEFGAPRLVPRLIDRILIPTTSRFLAVTESQRKFMRDVRRYPANKIAIIRNGVDANTLEAGHGRSRFAEIGLDPARPIIAMTARLHPVKDHTTFLRAARIVQDHLPQTQFVIIGDGPTRLEIETLRTRLGLEDSVRFSGLRRDIDSLLPAIDIHVLCSHSESMPLAVLEGMACGRPVICTDVGGTSEIVEHGVSGFLVPARDPAKVASYLINLLRDPELANRVGNAAKLRVQTEFSLTRNVEAIEAFLSKVAMENRT